MRATEIPSGLSCKQRLLLCVIDGMCSSGLLLVLALIMSDQQRWLQQLGSGQWLMLVTLCLVLGLKCTRPLSPCLRLVRLQGGSCREALLQGLDLQRSAVAAACVAVLYRLLCISKLGQMLLFGMPAIHVSLHLNLTVRAHTG